MTKEKRKKEFLDYAKFVQTEDYYRRRRLLLPLAGVIYLLTFFWPNLMPGDGLHPLMVLLPCLFLVVISSLAAMRWLDQSESYRPELILLAYACAILLFRFDSTEFADRSKKSFLIFSIFLIAACVSIWRGYKKHELQER